MDAEPVFVKEVKNGKLYTVGQGHEGNKKKIIIVAFLVVDFIMFIETMGYFKSNVVDFILNDTCCRCAFSRL